MFIDTDRKPYRIKDYESGNCNIQQAKLPAALFDELPAIAKSPHSSSSSSTASSMGGSDEGTIGGIMFDMLPSCHSITEEVPYITIEFNITPCVGYCHTYV
jgi:hypothetical protein